MKQPNNTKTKIYSTALYMRLSRDDENFGDSVSIETQRTILQKFAAENGLPVYGEYVEKSVIVGIKSRGLLRHKALLV